MNPYQFQNREIRQAAFALANALSDFDNIATAALEACEKRIAALETKGGNHDQVAPAVNLLSTRAQHLSDVAPHFQDLDPNAPHYAHGLSGRL